jgi:predicted O-methyltransferase YrrM
MADISKALAIDGWMSEDELRWLAQQASLCTRCVVEIGTYLGRSARAIADNLPNNPHISFYCVDPYKCYDDSVIGKQSQETLTSIREQAQNNLADVPVTFLCEASTTAVYGFNYYSIDFLFIDGNHSYKSVKADIQLWRNRIRIGGMLAGHDFGVHEGVAKAVSEAFADRFTLPVGSIWAMQM